MIANNEKYPSYFLSFRISSAFQKWTELKHVLTDKTILMSTKFWKLVCVADFSTVPNHEN